jgi:hypothetical protein
MQQLTAILSRSVIVSDRLCGSSEFSSSAQTLSMHFQNSIEKSHKFADSSLAKLPMFSSQSLREFCLFEFRLEFGGRRCLTLAPHKKARA